MADDPNIVVFSRLTPVAERIVFGIGGALSLTPLLEGWWVNHFAIPNFEHLTHAEIGLFAAWIFGSISLMAVSICGGTITVTIDRKARTLSEVVKFGPFTAIDKTAAFKELGEPLVYPHGSKFFTVEVPLKKRTSIQIGTYPTDTEAREVLATVIAALDVAEPLAEPVNPTAINPLKAAMLAGRGPLGF
jgi:hypothetical protein